MGRSPAPPNRNRNENNDEMKKGAWTSEEDQQLINYIQKHGHGSWRSLPKLAGLKRCGKSCRLRWTNYLRPDIKRGEFSQEEENVILHLHSIIGNKWSTIAARLPGRTDNEIKNYWNTHMKKKLLERGIDPMTHRPRTDLFSCLPQLVALANIRELLEHNQLAQNLQYLNLFLQGNTGLSTLLNRTNSIPQIQEENPNLMNEFPLEVGQESEEISQLVLVGNSNHVTQPLHDDQEVSIMNLQTSNYDHDIVGHGYGQSRFTSVNSSSSSSSATWTPIPPLMDTVITNNSGALESSTTVSYGGNTGGDGGGSSYEWPEYLFEDSFLDQNLREMC
ncbi:hypothetical protein L6452_04897 [Arctium lappa]|uniref:Uncharacterized protein n=1 Tax=Arctium lappa TaxID=4217 RepID=A0ACB9EG00_ARCLA|nr:hypothetical protein L6452_04897 [Arctium lappa]